MKTRKLFKRIAAIAFAVVLGIPCFAVSPSAVPAYAESTNEFDGTKVLDDLGETVVALHPAVKGAEPELYSFSEYCYSDNETLRNSNYGLYLYVYNPSQTEYSARIGANVVNMAISYGADGEPSEYANLRLKNCGHTTGKYEKLFYKFRVLDLDKVIENAVAFNMDEGARRYDVAGIQLLTEGKKLADDYGVGRSYYFSGYSKGCSVGTENASTLSCEWKELETIQLNVEHANYRATDYNEVCDELQTVYFEVDECYFQEYGGLQKITAEWYEYKTTPIFVTSDSSAYKALKPYIGKEIGNKNEDLHWRVLWSDTSGLAPVKYLFDRAYNGKMGNTDSYDDLISHYDWSAAKCLSRMDFLFERAGAKKNSDYKVSASEVQDYIDWYTNSLYPDKARVQGKYAADLFADSIDEDRVQYLENPSLKRGKIVQTINADDETEDLFIYKNQSFWDELWNGVQYEKRGYDPLVVLDSSSGIGAMGVDTFAKTYLIGDTHKQAVYDYCLKAIGNGKRAVLFRFAVTDYYSSTAYFDYAEEKDGAFNAEMSDQDGYVAQMTMFLDFDCISLGFRKSGVETVIAAIASPIDIINGVDPPPSLNNEKSGCEEFWDSVSSIFSTVILLVVIFFILKLIFKLRKIWRDEQIYKNTKK